MVYINYVLQVLDENIKVASGTIVAWQRKNETYELNQEFQDMDLTTDDIYDLLRERDYSYR